MVANQVISGVKETAQPITSAASPSPTPPHASHKTSHISESIYHPLLPPNLLFNHTSHRGSSIHRRWFSLVQCYFLYFESLVFGIAQLVHNFKTSDTEHCFDTASKM
ncbi:hypothetical protein AXX17_AT5G41680 [Arabidopsis thaliana]|uniref:Uncharacterized protein n=1 Tax=Arabidopsis thaliana TaxID=3702 RepID=A0A178UBR7_ARATH|nr:hypothetical protein AXX17_AT5G41680 [Arabidopsis thaliana]